MPPGVFTILEKEVIHHSNKYHHAPMPYMQRLTWQGIALHGGDLLSTPLVSGTLAYWGEGGAGRWITVYANAHHTFMVVAGLRFDTRDDPPGVNGPRWHQWMVDAHNFVSRHPPGL